jgi:hypothetical protein
MAPPLTLRVTETTGEGADLAELLGAELTDDSARVMLWGKGAHRLLGFAVASRACESVILPRVP